MEMRIPRITVDGVLFEKNTILLIKRKYDPFQGKWALPGGFVEYNETTEHAVIREVYEETGLKTKIHRLLGVYSDPSRDPRGHTITIAYILRRVSGQIRQGDDASDAQFFAVDDLPVLSFDHGKVIKDALKL